MEKTNAIRRLDQKKLPYTLHTYEGVISGRDVAAQLGEDPRFVFKTLVTTGKSGAHYVFLLPVAEELDLKKAAALVGEKSVAMLPQKELLPLTGYVHGGCSPIGMKKFFPTVMDRSAETLPFLYFSGGRIGLQIQTTPAVLGAMIPLRFGDLLAR